MDYKVVPSLYVIVQKVVEWILLLTLLLRGVEESLDDCDQLASRKALVFRHFNSLSSLNFKISLNSLALLKMEWFWIILTVLVTAAYLLLFRQFTIDHNFYWFIPIIILGIISFYGYYRLFSAGRVGVTYGLLTGSIVVLVAIGGVLFFSERLTWLNILALGLIVLGAILLAL